MQQGARLRFITARDREGRSLLRFLIGRHPSTTPLPHAKLFSELAPSVFGKKLARMKPVVGSDLLRDSRYCPFKLWIGRAAVMPKPVALRHFLQNQNLFHAPVAIGRQKNVITSETRIRNSDEDIMMKLALLPVRKKLVLTKERPDGFERLSESQCIK